MLTSDIFWLEEDGTAGIRTVCSIQRLDFEFLLPISGNKIGREELLNGVRVDMLAAATRWKERVIDK
jgi:hypothetical protein